MATICKGRKRVKRGSIVRIRRWRTKEISSRRVRKIKKRRWAFCSWSWYWIEKSWDKVRNSNPQHVLCLVTSTSYYLRGILSSVIASEIFSLKAYDFHLFTFTLFVFFFSSDLSSKPLLHGTIFSSLFLFFLTHSLTLSWVVTSLSLPFFHSFSLPLCLPLLSNLCCICWLFWYVSILIKLVQCFYNIENYWIIVFLWIFFRKQQMAHALAQSQLAAEEEGKSEKKVRERGVTTHERVSEWEKIWREKRK